MEAVCTCTLPRTLYLSTTPGLAGKEDNVRWWLEVPSPAAKGEGEAGKGQLHVHWVWLDAD